MSRGLGTLQTDILAVLAEKGSWFYSWEIACEICEKRATEITHAFDVSVRRAIKSLATRGLVHTGENRDRKYRTRAEGYDRLAVWLPEQSAPEMLITPLDGQQVETQIRTYLQSAPEQRPYFGGRYESLKPQFEAGDVQYCDLKNAVFSRIAISQDERPNANAAIRRALLRLEKAGEVTIKRAENGGIGLVRLIG